MTNKAILSLLSAFLLRKDKGLLHKGTVLSSIEKRITELIQKRNIHRSTIRFIFFGTNQIEATVKSLTDGSRTHTVRLTERTNIRLVYCAYSSNGNGFPFLHSIYVIREKYDLRNVYKYVEAQRHVATWNSSYENVALPVPL